MKQFGLKSFTTYVTSTHIVKWGDGNHRQLPESGIQRRIVDILVGTKTNAQLFTNTKNFDF